MRVCTCKHHVGERALPETEFPIKKRNCCRLCLFIIRKNERERNQERVRKEQQAWREQNKEHLSEYNKNYIKSERGHQIRFKSYERNREQKRCYDRVRWKTDPANRAKRLAAGAKYRAARLQATPSWFMNEQEAIEHLYFEAALMTYETGERHDVDHIVPLQGVTVSGLHTLSNLQIIPRRQNQSKKNKFW